MTRQLKLMGVLAHPDDESLGFGGTLAKYAAAGIATYLVTATRGEYGWFGVPEHNPGPDALGKIRERELQQAADILGIQDVTLLDYIDGTLDQANPQHVIADIVTHLRRIQPDVVLTFDPYGVYGHPDHIAICQYTTAAVVLAADASYAHGLNPHRVAKLYYRVETSDDLAIYEQAFGDLVMQVDGTERRGIGWPAWAITTRIDTTDYWQTVWHAVACHKTQLPGYESLRQLPEAQQRRLWGTETYYRAFSFVNSGRQIETDLFDGIQASE